MTDLDIPFVIPDKINAWHNDFRIEEQRFKDGFGRE